VQTSLGSVPGPLAVWEQAGNLWQDHLRERDKEVAFYERLTARNEKLIAEGHEDRVKWRDYTGKPTYIDQIYTSLVTVALGFLIATVIAVPLGIASGLSRTFNGAINPLIQIFKPVSPLAWLPIVMILVSGLYTSSDPLFEKSFISSAVTVSLCSLWPTLINTAVGVASVDPDHLNVARVLRLSWPTTVRKIVIPSALPLIFTGLRLSLGVGWMVLIAAEMLAQNPGLGKFVWDMFQNGSSQTLAQIMVAVFTIGLIGFALDRIMIALQNAVSFGRQGI
jgi:nitrate/nitrite transport system permease protein